MENGPTPTGEQIVKRMAAGQPWWKLQAGDIAPWIAGLPNVIRTNKYNRIEWIGRPWDGNSDSAVGEQPWDGERDTSDAEPLWNGEFPAADHVMRAADAALLVNELRRRIADLPLLGVALPDHRNLRACLAGPEGDASEPTLGTLTVDFDMGEMILPLCIEYWQLRPDIAAGMEGVADLMVRKLVHAAKHRGRLLRRELRMRGAFEDLIAAIGSGAAPLWLRLEPLRFDDDENLLAHLPYVSADISLDIHQVWAPFGVERVKGVKALRKLHSSRLAAHRRRVERLEQMRATGSAGWITDVALALIEERGLDPAEVFRRERHESLHGRDVDGIDERIDWSVADHFGLLIVLDGILRAHFSFPGGHYDDGRLIVDGSFPHAFAVEAPGRPLAAFVDHPAFVAAGATVSHAEQDDKRLTLHHEPRLITVEDAERRWAETTRRRARSED